MPPPPHPPVRVPSAALSYQLHLHSDPEEHPGRFEAARRQLWGMVPQCSLGAVPFAQAGKAPSPSEGAHAQQRFQGTGAWRQAAGAAGEALIPQRREK